jgi:BCCT family betaine/carnitine transporter
MGASAKSNSSTGVSSSAGSSDANVDWLIFTGGVVTICTLCVPLVYFPDAGKVALADAFEFLTQNFGVVYVAAACGVFCLLLYLALSRYGRITFGDEAPEFSTFSWAAMLFCGGIGTSVLYWGTVEWAHYYQAPPFAVEALTPDALRWSISYPIFHWGLLGWSFYCLPGIAIGIAFYRSSANTLRLSEACAPVIGEKAHGPIGRFIDLLYVVGLVGAASTGIGLAVPLVGALLADIFAADRTSLGFAMDVVVIGVVTCIFASSVWFGLEKGIRRLSDLNVYLAFLLLLFVLMAGPTLYIVEMGVAGVGHMLQNFVKMSTWTDPDQTSDFVEAWTVFYWAWWLALGPYMGIFIAKISQGRSIKQIIFGCLGYGTLGCTVFFVVFGNYSAYLELNGLVPVLQVLNDNGAPAAIVEVLRTLPWADAAVVMFTVVCLIFAATSYDSASYTLATVATRDLKHHEHPERWHRVFWAFLLGLLPISLIYVGGLRPLQSAVTLASVPLLLVLVVISWGMLINLRRLTAEPPAEGTPATTSPSP